MSQPRSLPMHSALANTPNAFESFKTVFFRMATRSNSRSSTVTRLVTWNNSGSKIATLQNDRSVRIWMADRPEAKMSVVISNAHDRPISDVSWNPLHSDELVSCSIDGTLKKWDTRNKKLLQSYNAGEDLLSVRYSPCGQYIAACSKANRIFVVDAKDVSQQVTTAAFEEPYDVYDMAWSNGSDYLALALQSGNARVLRFDTRRSPPELVYSQALRGHRTTVVSVQFDPRGRWLAVGSNDGIVTLWDIAEWVCVKTFAKTDQPVSSVAFSHDGLYLAIGSDNGQPVDIVYVEAAADDDPYVYSVKGVKYVERPTVEWHPLRHCLAISGEADGFALVGKS